MYEPEFVSGQMSGRKRTFTYKSEPESQNGYAVGREKWKTEPRPS
jgi:hypothetical protein